MLLLFLFCLFNPLNYSFLYLYINRLKSISTPCCFSRPPDFISVTEKVKTCDIFHPSRPPAGFWVVCLRLRQLGIPLQHAQQHADGFSVLTGGAGWNLNQADPAAAAAAAMCQSYKSFRSVSALIYPDISDGWCEEGVKERGGKWVRREDLSGLSWFNAVMCTEGGQGRWLPSLWSNTC